MALRWWSAVRPITAIGAIGLMARLAIRGVQRPDAAPGHAGGTYKKQLQICNVERGVVSQSGNECQESLKLVSIKYTSEISAYVAANKQMVLSGCVMESDQSRFDD